METKIWEVDIEEVAGVLIECILPGPLSLIILRSSMFMTEIILNMIKHPYVSFSWLCFLGRQTYWERSEGAVSVNE